MCNSPPVAEDRVTVHTRVFQFLRKLFLTSELINEKEALLTTKEYTTRSNRRRNGDLSIEELRNMLTNTSELRVRGALARPFSCRSASARPYVFFACSALVEHWAFNLMVAGSSPAIPKPNLHYTMSKDA
ncbi:hypothetical protein QVD17_12078 [Tagetes erecta]|uniref:Uncharacterized protein n=1 Tax=Tagetes erecta TaxID=13708 RepID=A0AAD8KUI9_TARER|nr:hypothetical protein QVD17_12078 [Tagetes erecta]